MAVDFMDEINNESEVVFNLKIMIQYLRGCKYKLFIDLWQMQLESIASFCRKTMMFDEQLAGYIWNEFTKLREYVSKKKFIEAADVLDGLLPYVYKAMELRGHIDVEDDNYRLFSSKSGYLTIQDLSSGDYLASSVDPMWEAKEKAESIYNAQIQYFCSIGCIFGYLQWQVYQKHNGLVDIYVYETDKKWIEYAYEYGVLSWIPEEKLHICVEPDPYKLINKVIDEHESNTYYTSLFIEDRIYYSLTGDARILGNSISQCVVTQANFLETVELNFYSNYSLVKHDIDDLELKDHNEDWIVVGGGPSVDDCIDYLKENVGKKVIIAATTILKRLLKEEIRPDYIAVIDMQNRTYGHIEGIENEDIPLIMTDCANWQFGKRYHGEKYYIPTSGMPFSKNLYEALNKKPWDVGGTVTAVSMQIAVKLGAKSVELIGVDLSYPNNYSHASGTMDYAKVDEGKLFPVKSVDGGMVNTDNVMKSYIDEIEDIITNNKKVRFYNLSKHGALIRGCQQKVK